MRAQVEALVASISYDPPVPVLDPADGPRIAAIGLAKARANDPILRLLPERARGDGHGDDPAVPRCTPPCASRCR